MSFRKILGAVVRVGGALAPGVGTALEIVNDFLPAGKKLPLGADADEVAKAYDSLPDAERLEIDRRAKVEIAEIQASADKLGYMVQVESVNSNTRPRIALMMAWVVVLAIGAMLSLLFIALVMQDSAYLNMLTNSWELALVLLATPTALLRAYFGMRTKEKQARYAAASGQEFVPGLAGTLKSLIAR